MRTKTANIALATALGLGGLTTGLVVAPAMASAATSQVTATQAVGDRLTKLKGALSGLVTDGTLTQAQADSVATTLDEALPKRGGHGGPGGHHGGPGGGHGGPGRHHGGPGRHHGARHGLEAAATTLGITPEELRTALRGGQSLADVAASKGVAKEKLIAALVEEAKEHLAEKVTAGRLTQAEADTRLAELTAKITERVEQKGLPGRPGRGDAPR